jgi:hypothetical protein
VLLPAVKSLPDLAFCDTSHRKNATEAPRDGKDAVTEKDLYSAILSVLQSHFDSTGRPRSASHAVQAHQIGQDAINDWLSAKLPPL